MSELAPVDLRSDTVTRPTPAMRRAMASAEVGDDVFGEDPTVRALEERSAAMLGKEAALYTVSGTLANQLAVKVWTRPGQQMIAEARSHFARFEPAGLSLLSGVVLNPVSSPRGWFGRRQAAERLEAAPYGTLATGLVAVENSHNQAGGVPFPLAELADLAAFCRQRGLPLHMDGARLFNAAAADGVAAAEITRHVDSVMFCLSKGLACPVGSVLAGPRDFIAEARQVRQILGGGWRQAGVIAAAGLLALERMVERLPEDHRRARRLAEGLARLPGVRLDPAAVRTNIVVFELAEREAPAVEQELAEHGVRCFAIAPRTVRMVTHYEITDDDVERAIRAAEACLAPSPAER